jgi:hypothetical protein
LRSSAQSRVNGTNPAGDASDRLGAAAPT